MLLKRPRIDVIDRAIQIRRCKNAHAAYEEAMLARQHPAHPQTPQQPGDDGAMASPRVTHDSPERQAQGKSKARPCPSPPTLPNAPR